MKVKDNKLSQVCGTLQDRNIIHLDRRRLQWLLKILYLQSQQICSSKENFNNRHL